MNNDWPSTFGWVPDLPDPRDYGPAHPVVSQLLDRLDPAPITRLKRLDWTEYFLPAVDSLELDAAPAHACVGLAEYFERRSNGSATPLSRLFLFQMARRLASASGGSEAGLRTTLKALARFGLPPERFCPYEPGRLLEPVEPFLFSYTRELDSLVYFRLDPVDTPGEVILRSVKTHLAAGFPSVFGFSAFDSISADPDIPPPSRFDAVKGGAAAIAVGFDDTRRIRSTRGALRIRAPWGERWGEAGYGWLPYAYIEEGLAADFWTLTRAEWMASEEYARPKT